MFWETMCYLYQAILYILYLQELLLGDSLVLYSSFNLLTFYLQTSSTWQQVELH